MTTLTRTEIRWIMNLVKDKRDNANELAQKSPIPFNSLAQLEFENMAYTYDRLESLLKNNGKRIAIK